MKFLNAFLQLVPTLRAFRVFAGANARVQWTPDGQIVEAIPAPRWQHPWSVTAEWRPKTPTSPEGWVASLKAGFVNGKCPIITTTVERAQAPTLIREMETKAQKVSLSDPTASIDAPLFDRPQIELGWRPIGRDGDSSSVVPAFFTALGVGKPPKAITEESIGQPTNIADDAVPAGNRLLRACDLVLIQPRTGLTAETTVSNPLADSVTLTQTLDIQAPDPSLKLRVVALADGIQPTDGIDPTQNQYVESTQDEQRIATVYLLSPPDVPLGSSPDPTWTPYVKYDPTCFWNLNWAQPLAVFHITDNLTLSVPLAEGIAQPLVNSLLATNNDAYNAAYNNLQAHSLAGHFWTV